MEQVDRLISLYCWPYSHEYFRNTNWTLWVKNKKVENLQLSMQRYVSRERKGERCAVNMMKMQALLKIIAGSVKTAQQLMSCMAFPEDSSFVPCSYIRGLKTLVITGP